MMAKFTILFALILSSFYGQIHTQYDAEDKLLDECTQWHAKCAEFQELYSPLKSCQGFTIFNVASFTSHWSSSRFFCSFLFNNPKADLLYFDVNGDRDLESFLADLDDVEILKNFKYQAPTSALCCPLHDEFICKWPFNGEVISKKSYEHLSDHMSEHNTCYYLIVDLNSSHKHARFVTAITVDRSSPSNIPELPVICTYKKPSHCDETTTPKSTTETTGPTSTRSTTITTQSPKTTTSKPSPEFCPELHDAYGMKLWPQVNVGEESHVNCPDGYVGDGGRWRCGPDGRFVPEGPTIDCTSKWISNFTEEINKVKNISDLSEKVKDLKIEVEKKTLNFSTDLRDVIQVIFHIDVIFQRFVINSTRNNSSSIDQKAVVDVTKHVVESCSSVVDSKAWNNSKPNERINLASNMLKYVQNSGLTMGCFVNNHSKRVKPLSINNIYMSTFNLDQDTRIFFDHMDYSFELKNPLKTNETVSDWCPYRMGVGAIFKQLSIYMFDDKLNKNLVMNSEIVAFTYNNKSEKTFPLPDGNEAQMSLLHHQSIEFGVEPKCVFWNYETKSWSTDGCWVNKELSNRNQTICQCDHLTNFAVLMDVTNQERPSKWKSIITIITCTLSIVCLIIVISIFTICRELHSRRSWIIVNISIMMFIINLLVIFGLDRTDVPILCESVSVALLFSLLALFFWMLIEGYNLYQMMVLIFSNKGRVKTIYLYLIGYGVPFVLTIASASYMYFKTELTNEYFCWITSTKYPYQIWFLVGPVTIIILINSVIMIRVMKIVLKKRVKSINPESSSSMFSGRSHSSGAARRIHGNLRTNMIYSRSIQQRNVKEKSINENYVNNNGEAKDNQQQTTTIEEKMTEWCSYLKGFFGLIVLMGITWISYLLYIHKYGHYFSYVFIIMNGLQGVFIFITQFLFNKKAMFSVKKRIFHLFGYNDYLSSSSRTTSSYLSQQQRNNKTQTGNKKLEDDDLNFTVDDVRPAPHALIDRTTSVEL